MAKTMKSKSEEKAVEPTPEQLLKWMERDLEAAIAFLKIVRSNPKIMAMILDELISVDKQLKQQN